jgi:hypothetical protein
MLSIKLRKRLTEDKATKRIPLKESADTQYNTISGVRATGANRYHDLLSDTTYPGDPTKDPRFGQRVADPSPSQGNREWGNK